ncbi:hypothetical protein [Comamonas sp.]|uniref:hypothetical protein n=1 Tax=Comamonas sp. TaxID=34028 RepID=UPI00289B2B73|nr:hypothetical protein [Comamonas sp.]
MKSRISTQFCDLYLDDELKRVQQFFELGKALELLACSALDQESSIPDCPTCEIWSKGFWVVQQFTKIPPNPLSFDFTDGLQGLYDLDGGSARLSLDAGIVVFFQA